MILLYFFITHFALSFTKSCTFTGLTDIIIIIIIIIIITIIIIIIIIIITNIKK
jgi:hypothetical protein